MKVMVIVKPTKNREAGGPPSKKMLRPISEPSDLGAELADADGPRRGTLLRGPADLAADRRTT
jgi:hypothetical protein